MTRDPVEYPLALIRQTQVGRLLAEPTTVRALLRRLDILVGEIRDADTATMALRAALTGHQVVRPLHANSALGTIPRPARDPGIGAELLAATSAASSPQPAAQTLPGLPRAVVPDDAP